MRACSLTFDSSFTQFKLLSTSIEETVYEHFHNLADASRACSRLITSEATSNNWNFPFVTMSSFELYAKEARDRAHIESLMYLPLVPGNTVSQFNDYMRDNEDWVERSRELLQAIDANAIVDSEPFQFVDTMFDNVNGELVALQGSGPFTPVWQWSPPPEGGISSTAIPIGKENLASFEDASNLMTASTKSNGEWTCSRLSL